MAKMDAPAAEGRRSTAMTAALVVGISVFLVGAGVILAPVLLNDDSASAVPSMTARPTTASPTPTTPTDDTPVPKPGPLKSALNIRVLFAIQSIGSDIVKGVPIAYTRAKLPKPTVVKWSVAPKKRGPLLATATIGRNGEPLSKLKAFADLVNGAPRDSVQVAVMAFNYQDVSAETDVEALFQSYLATMDSLETANPDITLLYSTVPVTGGNSWRELEADKVEGLSGVTQPVWQDNIARERFNTMIRQQYAATGRLYDIAALQADLGKGKVAAKEHENQFYYVLNPALSSNGRRLNTTGSVKLARALMTLAIAAAKA